MPDEPIIPPPQDWMLPISEEDPGLRGGAPGPAPEPGPPRCACGYLLGGLVEKGGLVRCPECGNEQRADGSDAPLRRDWAYMFAILIVPSVLATFGVFGATMLTIDYAFRPFADSGTVVFGVVVAGLLMIYPATTVYVVARRHALRRASRRSLWALVVLLAIIPQALMLIAGGWILIALTLGMTALCAGSVYAAGSTPRSGAAG